MLFAKFADNAATIVVLLLVMFPAGWYATRSLPSARLTGVIFGVIAFLIALLAQSLTVSVCIGAVVCGASWVALPVCYVVWLVISGVCGWLLSSPGSSGGPLLPLQKFIDQLNRDRVQRRQQQRESKDAKQLAAVSYDLEQALQRIRELENRPDALPENVDAMTRITAEWSKERERIVRSDDDDKHQQLARVDSDYGKQLAELLAQQEDGSNG